ncbi:ubiquinone biosynthesis protein UbiA [Segetibacter sp. 3557_3]|uniref:geranylgeranylglycerol-phosphate geranylgeranyltransferase n=1 Tax=Segetibacter sp. 3557_3 TaxID=2547429 RepID=UPI0010584DBF|nr:geranylgeranylglycerol-phosphate geranylgeranyltransferase [Segetibacter sp. 3557_3]TDH26530.1 ubiquinone biosynthesis protein UbiA [Segetibacter sp. 3557_3]
MKLLSAFMRLIRWPNLVFIAITQLLFVYCIVHPVFEAAGVVPNISGIYFLALAAASVLIAAAGYIINDYFDLNIDRVNKPDKLVVDKIINRRSVILWHLLFSLLGVLLSFFVDWLTSARFITIANLGCVLLLFLYSISLKKKLLSGNVVISLLTAWVILVITWAETSNLLQTIDTGSYTEKITRITFLYAGFAFVISLIREVVKDMEDIEGDRRYGCRTMPIVWGINVSKVFVAVWMIVLMAALLIVQFYVLQFRWWFSAIYCILFVIVPLLLIFRKLFTARTSADYHQLSSWIKIVMFTGILSMVFFRIYL